MLNSRHPKSRASGLGRVRTAPNGHDCADCDDCEDPEVNAKSLKAFGIITFFAKLASPKPHNFDFQGRIYLKVESVFFFNSRILVFTAEFS